MVLFSFYHGTTGAFTGAIEYPGAGSASRGVGTGNARARAPAKLQRGATEVDGATTLKILNVTFHLVHSLTGTIYLYIILSSFFFWGEFLDGAWWLTFYDVYQWALGFLPQMLRRPRFAACRHRVGQDKRPSGATLQLKGIAVVPWATCSNAGDRKPEESQEPRLGVFVYWDRDEKTYWPRFWRSSNVDVGVSNKWILQKAALQSANRPLTPILNPSYASILQDQMFKVRKPWLGCGLDKTIGWSNLFGWNHRLVGSNPWLDESIVGKNPSFG